MRLKLFVFMAVSATCVNSQIGGFGPAKPITTTTTTTEAPSTTEASVDTRGGLLADHIGKLKSHKLQILRKIYIGVLKGEFHSD